MGFNAPTAPFLGRFIDPPTLAAHWRCCLAVEPDQYNMWWTDRPLCNSSSRYWKSSANGVWHRADAEESVYGMWFGKPYQLMVNNLEGSRNSTAALRAWQQLNHGVFPPLAPQLLDIFSKFTQKKLDRFCCCVQWDPRMAWVGRDMMVNFSYTKNLTASTSLHKELTLAMCKHTHNVYMPLSGQ